MYPTLSSPAVFSLHDQGGKSLSRRLHEKSELRVSDLTTLDKELDQQNEYAIEDMLSSLNLKLYYYHTQTYLDDFDEEMLCARQAQLGKYFIWKTKKWIGQKKREKLEQEFEATLIVCKICAKQIRVRNMKDHSMWCRKEAEKLKEIKDHEKKLNEAVFDAFMKSRELNTKMLVAQ